jgi:hypothetical protein
MTTINIEAAKRAARVLMDQGYINTQDAIEKADVDNGLASLIADIMHFCAGPQQLKRVFKKAGEIYEKEVKEHDFDLDRD